MDSEIHAIPLIGSIDDAIYAGRVQIFGDAESQFMVRNSEPVTERVVKFGDVTDDYSMRVFLMPRHLPSSTNPKMRSKVRVHPDLETADYFPVILYKIRGGTKDVMFPDRSGYFVLPYPEDKLVEDDNEKREYKFKVKDTIFESPDPVLIDEDFATRFMNSDNEGFSIFLQTRNAFLIYADIESWVATMLSLWVLSSFVYQTFSAFPYIYLLAERNSGKSRVLKTISYLANTGMYLVSPRLAQMYRLGDSLSPNVRP